MWEKWGRKDQQQKHLQAKRDTWSYNSVYYIQVSEWSYQSNQYPVAVYVVVFLVEIELNDTIVKLGTEEKMKEEKEAIKNQESYL